MQEKTVLSIVPWITDFAAFDLWMQPLGLLRLSTQLKALGFSVTFLNLLDRFDADLLRRLKRERPMGEQAFGCGKFHKEEIERPEILKSVKRSYYRYGFPLPLFREKLERLKAPPDIILVSQVMTYWYPGSALAVKILKEYFPSSPVVLGGIYPVLMPEHAQRAVGPDHVCAASSFDEALSLVLQVLGCAEKKKQAYGFADIPRVDYDFLSDKRSAVLETVRGCPLRCRYCSQHVITKGVAFLPPGKVADDMTFYREMYGAENFVFYDDALAFRKEEHLIPILKKILEKRWEGAAFHIPNGISVRSIDEELAELLFACRFRTIRLSLETSSPERQRESGGKVENKDFIRAVAALSRAGYRAEEIEAYTMMGLPGQTLDDVRADVDFIFESGASPVLTAYSPTPHSDYFEHYYKESLRDPLLHNNTLFFLRFPGGDEDTVRAFRQEVKDRKRRRSKHQPPDGHNEMV